MPIWTADPPTNDEVNAIDLIRTPAGKPIVACVSSPEITGCRTHYAHSRTVPCEGQGECGFCEEGHSWRWHGYLGCLILESMRHVVFEFTASASDSFKTYLEYHDSLRGCWFKASRAGKRPNGKVIIQCKPGDTSKIRLPNPLDVQAIMCHIWNIQHKGITTTVVETRAGVQIHVPKGNGDGRYRA